MYFPHTVVKFRPLESWLQTLNLSLRWSNQSRVLNQSIAGGFQFGGCLRLRNGTHRPAFWRAGILGGLHQDLVSLKI